MALETWGWFGMVRIIWRRLGMVRTNWDGGWVAWEKSLTNWMKVNFDRLGKHNQKKATESFVIKDPCDKVSIALSINFGNASVLVAECIALRNV
ncbi:hypothetical protein L1049_006790 [Liquidambar formosana]|uniref:Uncharacterized protein n=1 Tax=Liquidambar formosana TaxID=63359 RepID=A0AAP0RG43_LIQFO